MSRPVIIDRLDNRKYDTQYQVAHMRGFTEGYQKAIMDLTAKKIDKVRQVIIIHTKEQRNN